MEIAAERMRKWVKDLSSHPSLALPVCTFMNLFVNFRVPEHFPKEYLWLHICHVPIAVLFSSKGAAHLQQYKVGTFNLQEF